MVLHLGGLEKEWTPHNGHLSVRRNNLTTKVGDSDSNPKNVGNYWYKGHRWEERLRFKFCLEPNFRSKTFMLYLVSFSVSVEIESLGSSVLSFSGRIQE